MSSVDRAIVLAAGRGHQADGLAKILIRHPVTGRTILEHAVEAFSGKRVQVVVGFRAIEIMSAAPELDYVVNHDWSLTNNAMSLGLALDDEPTYVVSGDIFFERDLIERLDGEAPDLVLTDGRANRTLTAVHCALGPSGDVAEMYQGPLRDAEDPEAIGLFKISHRETLQRWKRASIDHGNLFVGQTLPCDRTRISAVPLDGDEFTEINTPSDYLRWVERLRRS